MNIPKAKELKEKQKTISKSRVDSFIKNRMKILGKEIIEATEKLQINYVIDLTGFSNKECEEIYSYFENVLKPLGYTVELKQKDMFNTERIIISGWADTEI